MRAGHCVSWLLLLVLAASQDDIDSEESRKVLGSSVVTSVSVIMDHGNGTKTYITDAAGQPLTQNEGPVGSPGELLAPDRYEFYTFDESGDLVKRLMTLDQIQGLIAGGDNDALDTDSSGPMYYHENLPTDSNGHMDVTDMEIPDVQGVRNVVASVQNVLKGELEATKKRPVSNKPLAILNVPDAASSWSILLPAMLGTGDGPEDDSPEMERINLTEAVKESTTLQTTTTVLSTTSTTTTTTPEPPTTIKYVTKRPTDSPTIVHYLPIHNIPTKKPIQIVKTSTQASPSARPPPGSSALPVMEELSASLTSVIAQVTNHTAGVEFVPVQTTTELSTTEAPTQNSTVLMDTVLNSHVSPNLAAKNEINNSALNGSKVKINTSSVSGASVIKAESLEAQSSNENTPTYVKTNIPVTLNPIKERIKPPTIDETLKEFISTTISGSDFSVNPIRVTVSTPKPLEDKLQTKSPVKPLTQVQETSKPLNSTSNLSPSKDSILSGQHDSSIDKREPIKQSILNTNKTDTNKPVKVSELLNNSTSDILSTFESILVNTELRNSPSTVKPAQQPAVSPNATSSSSTELVASSNTLSQNVTALPEPVKYNTTLSMGNLEVPLPEMSESVKEKPSSTSTMKPVKSETAAIDETTALTSEKPAEDVFTSTTSHTFDDSTNESTLAQSDPAYVEVNNTKPSGTAATNVPVSTTESTQATNSEIDTESTTDKIKNDDFNSSNSLMASETIGNAIKSNTSATVSSTDVTKSQNSTNTKPITDIYFTITTYKPAISKPIQVNTKTNNNIEYNTKISSVKPQDEHSADGNNRPLHLNKSSIDVKLKTSESQQVSESLSTSSSASAPYVPTTVSLILNSSLKKQKPAVLSTESEYDKDEPTVPSNIDSVTESTVFTTMATDDAESTDTLNMEDDPSVHESISAVTNILLEDKPHEPPNEPQIPLPTAGKEPKPAVGELKHASIHAEDDRVTTEVMYSTFSATEEPDSTTVSDTYTTELIHDTVNKYNTSLETSNHALTDENLQASSSSIHSTSDVEPNSTERNYEATTDSVTTVEDDNLTTIDESIEVISTESTTTIGIEENVKSEPLIQRPSVQVAPTKESKLNPDQITQSDANNIPVIVNDSIIEEHMLVDNVTDENITADIVTDENITADIVTDENITADNVTMEKLPAVNVTFEKVTTDNLITQSSTQTNVTNGITTSEPILISSSNDKKESTPLPTIENISTVTLDPITSNKDKTEAVTEKIALKSAVKPHDTKIQLLKKPAVQNSFRPLPDPPLTPPSAVELHPAPHESMGLEASTAFLGDDVRRFSDLCNELAFRMWTSITGKGSITSRSLVFSPFSATSLLAMVFLGARGPTSGQMNDILRLDDMVTFNPHQVLQNITESVLNSRNYGVATAAFIRELYSDKLKGKILDFYKERAQQYYDGHVEEIAFNVVGDILRRRTNLLVKRQTLGRIPEYLRGSGLNLRPPLAAFSANIFQTDCEQASIDGRDGEMYFVVRPSTRQRRLVPVPAAVWRTGFLAGYEPGLDATAVSLGADTVVSTLLILPGQQGQVAPGDGLARLEQRLIETSYRRGGWSRLLRSLLPRPGLELQVPRFSHRSVLNVTGALQRMGLKDLFNEGRADLRGLNGLSNELHLSDMVQVNTFSTCGEEAIGARHHVETYPVSPQRMGRDEPEYYPDFEDEDSIYMSIPLSLRPRQARLPDNPRLRFDRPFLYMVRHNPTGMILYMGRFNPRLLP